MKVHYYSKGVSILEVIIGAAIILILTTTIGRVWVGYIMITQRSNDKAQAALLIDEASDAIRFMRDNDWSANIAPNNLLDTTLYLNWSTTTDTYSLSTSVQPLIQDKFTRTILIESITRDGQFDISNSGVIDPDTRKVIITVLINQPSPQILVQSEILIHNSHDN